MSTHSAPLRTLIYAAGLLALVSVVVEAGAHNSGGKHEAEHEARMKVLRDNVEKAMRELYMENADVQVDKMSLLGGMNPMLNGKPGSITKGKAIPFGHLEAFGREDTAAELTEASIDESNKMVDQIERAVVSETKRSMFRALTRLRGATIANFDGMANAQSANVNDYVKQKQWTKSHQLNHLANQEGDVESWAFPNEESEKVKPLPKKGKKADAAAAPASASSAPAAAAPASAPAN